MNKQRNKALFWVACIVGIILFVLIGRPYTPGEYLPIILGIFPAPLFYFILFTALFTLFVYWIAFIWDPYHWLEEYSGEEVQDEWK